MTTQDAYFEEETVVRRAFLLPGFLLILLLSLLTSCNPTEMTPTQDSSIVWSDDFEDGDTEGWEDSRDPFKLSNPT